MSFMPLTPFIFYLAAGMLTLLIGRKTFSYYFLLCVSLIQTVLCFLFVHLAHQGEFLVTQVSGWQAPFGISIVIDSFSAIMLSICNLICFLTVIYSRREVRDNHNESHPSMYYTLLCFLMTGVNGTFITGDLFNMYVCYEIMILSSIALLNYQNLEYSNRKENFQRMLKYAVYNLISSSLFLLSLGIIYGYTGTLNLAHLSVMFSLKDETIGLIGPILLFMAFALKAGLFPLFQWLPASYPLYIGPTSALFSGLLTKVGIYSLIRTMTLFLPNKFYHLQDAVIFVASATMIIGVLGAVCQMHMKRILSYHIISQVGYMVMGIALFTKDALAATAFYIVHHILAKVNLFFIQGVSEYLTETDQLDKQGGLRTRHPYLALNFLISAFALAGIPPLSGFFAKYLLIFEGLLEKSYLLVASAIITGLLTIFSMIKIWNYSFSGKEKKSSFVRIPKGEFLIICFVSLMIIAFGVFYPVVWPYFEEAGKQLSNHKKYIQQVLGLII